MTAPRIDQPEAGFFWTRLVKGGPKVGVRIWLEKSSAPDRVADWRAEIDGKPADANEAWNHNAHRRITEAEYRFLVADSAHAKAHRPDDPRATPDLPVAWDNQRDPLNAAAALMEEWSGKTMSYSEGSAIEAIEAVKRARLLVDRLDEASADATKDAEAEFNRAEEPYTTKIGALIEFKNAMQSHAEECRAKLGVDRLVSDLGVGMFPRRTSRAVIVDSDLLPHGFLQPDMGKIADALKRGEDVPGATLETETTYVIK